MVDTFRQAPVAYSSLVNHEYSQIDKSIYTPWEKPWQQNPLWKISSIFEEEKTVAFHSYKVNCNLQV